MRITHKIRSTRAIGSFAGNGARLVCSILNPTTHSEKLKELGFTQPLVFGESLVPDAKYGPASRINAEGWEEVHKDRPKETAYRQVLWRWRMKRGWDYEEAERIVDVPYQRYPRTEHPPIGLELRITPRTDGSVVVTLPLRTLTNGAEEKLIVHSVNLLIEIFGECYVLTENLDELVQAEIKRLNWRVLPPGQQTWEKVEETIQKLLEQKPAGTHEVIQNRFRVINSHEPDFVAIGRHGFSGYVVFGFSQKRFFLLESIYFGNATYVLGDNWEALSQKTKAELIDQQLCQARIVHREGWEDEIERLLG